MGVGNGGECGGLMPTNILADEIKKEVVVCTKCNLCKTRTNAVPGAGAYDADIMFVGEAPGRSEDRYGEPFVGAAGSRLTDALEKAGLSRDEVYITNVVKCRPPENRVPTQPERDACSEYLKQEITAVRPRIVCILGNTAFGSILGGSEITKNRGKTARMGGQLYFITVHPAATIYNQQLIRVLDADIKRLVDISTILKNGNGSEISPDIDYDQA